MRNAYRHTPERRARISVGILAVQLAKREHGEPVTRPAVSDRPELVARIQQMRESGMTLRAIAAQLTSDGVPTLRGARHWRPSALQTVLGNTRSTDAKKRQQALRTASENAARAASGARCSWESMMARCFKPSNDSYPWYGARGITVCPRWHSFEAFFADMGERPDGRTLDRIDVDGNYEPSNCRWETHHEQRVNQRRMGRANG